MVAKNMRRTKRTPTSYSTTNIPVDTIECSGHCEANAKKATAMEHLTQKMLLLYVRLTPSRQCDECGSMIMALILYDTYVQRKNTTKPRSCSERRNGVNTAEP